MVVGIATLGALTARIKDELQQSELYEKPCTFAHEEVLFALEGRMRK